MKKLLFLGLLLFAIACDNKPSEINIGEGQLNQNNLTLLKAAIGFQLPNDSLKPPIIKQAGVPTIFEIPTTTGKSKTNTYYNKNKAKIELVPPVVNTLAVGLAQGKSNFATFTTDQGLALDAIGCSFKDSKGNLWFGTDGGGVSRYDGKSFVNFTATQGLANNSVWSICEDRKGNIWFGTFAGGVSRYDGNSFLNFTKEQGLADNTVRCITLDNKGNLWFGTEGGGVSRYDGKSFITLTAEDGLANNNVRSVIQDNKGDLWFGTFGGGVSRYDGRAFTNYTMANGLVHNSIWCITQDNKGDLWFGTRNGVSRYDGKSFTNFSISNDLIGNFILCITEDKIGNLWFGTNGGGVSKFDGKSFTNYTTSQGLSNNNVWSIKLDSNRDLWFSTNGGGVCRYEGESFINFTTAYGLSNNSVRSIIQDREGNFWFGTDGGGINKYDKKSFTNYTTRQGLPNNDIRSINMDSTGNLWFGTENDGVSRYNGKYFVNYTRAQGLANNDVRSIAQDRNGNIWFGTNGGGISKYDGKFFVNYTTAQGLVNNFVNSITQDSKGDLWFGTNGGGVSRYDGKSFTNFSTLNGLTSNNVLCSTEDKTGNIWIGTYGGGVSRYDGKSFLNFTTAQGLPDNGVTQIVITKQQNIAIGTNFGIGVAVAFSPKERGKQTINNIPTQNNLSNEELKNYDLVIEIYNSSTGYPIKDVNAGQNCMMTDNQGIIWAGTGSDKTGLVRFDYSALNKNTAPPVVCIQNVKINQENICWYNLSKKHQWVNLMIEKDSTAALADSTTMLLAEFNAFGKTVPKEILDNQQEKFAGLSFDSVTPFYPLPKNLVLPYEHNNVSFDFNAIETGRPYLVNYQYILEGYDNEWSPLTKKTSATFGNIYEGSYTFKLKAQSPEGIWSEPISYTFKVLPPWYRTWWMYSVDVLLIFILLFVAYRWRTASLRKDKQLLEATVEERTRELAEKTIVAETNEKEALKQKEIANDQKQLVEEKQKEILDSIHYASRIQQALLTGEEYIKENLKAEYFILYKPKDIVAGDFYWALYHHHLFYIATCDCTGHGVPGAFMSMLNISFLNENVIERNIKMPDEILNAQRTEIIKALNPKGNENSKDGMDCVLCAYDFEKMQLKFAGAYNQPYIVRSGELLEFKGDRMSVGKHERDMESFTLRTIELQKGDVVYTFTDGYPDQFGTSNKKLKSRALKEMLVKIYSLSMQEQKQYLDNFIEDWKGSMEQTDDILVIGVKIE